MRYLAIGIDFRLFTVGVGEQPPACSTRYPRLKWQYDVRASLMEGHLNLEILDTILFETKENQNNNFINNTETPFSLVGLPTPGLRCGHGFTAVRC